MGNNLRMLYDQLGRRSLLSGTNEDANHPRRNAVDGNLHTIVKSTTTGGTWDLIFDLGVGVTGQADYVAIGRADMLVAVGATVDWSDSPDASAYTSRFSEAMGAPDLFAPASRHFTREYSNPGAKRAWRLRLTAGSGGVYAFATVDFGLKLEVGRQPSYPAELGPTRTLRGATYGLTFRLLSVAQRDALLTYVAAVTPDYPGDSLAETPAGVLMGGGLPHWIYDPVGQGIFAAAATPALVPVTLVSPDSRATWSYLTTNEIALAYRTRP